MKSIKMMFGLLITISLLNACVSANKYNTAVNAYKTSDQAYKSCEKEKSALAASSSQELMQKSQELATKQQELAEKENLLKQREQKLADLNEMVNEQKVALQGLKKEVCDALKCFTPDELSIEVRDGKLYVSLSDKLLFPSGSDAVDSRGKEAISMLSAVLANSTLEVMVEGHTDNVPISNIRNKDNWDLGAHRATSVARLMIDDGIGPERIITSGRGEYHPLAANATSEGRQKNRRTEIVLAPKLDKLWKLTEEENKSLSNKLEN